MARVRRALMSDRTGKEIASRQMSVRQARRCLLISELRGQQSHHSAAGDARSYAAGFALSAASKSPRPVLSTSKNQSAISLEVAMIVSSRLISISSAFSR